MKTGLTKRALAELVEERLVAGISEGEWEGWLPAERRLAESLQVSRTTLREALERMGARGLLAVEGKRTRIMKKARAGKDKVFRKRRVCLLSPHGMHELPAVGLFLYGELGRRLAPLGASLDVVTFHALNESCSPARLERFLRGEKADLWLLLRSHPAVQEFFIRKRLPMVVIGTPEAETSHVEVDYMAAMRHAIGTLRRGGHSPEGIVCYLPDSGLPTHGRLRDLFSAECEGGAVQGHRENRSDLFAGTRRLLAKDCRWTAAIVLRGAVATSLHGMLPTAFGKRLPEDFSLICLDDSPQMGYLFPALSRYTVNLNLLANKTMRLIENQLDGKGAGKSAVLVPDFLPGQTHGPVCPDR